MDTISYQTEIWSNENTEVLERSADLAKLCLNHIMTHDLFKDGTIPSDKYNGQIWFKFNINVNLVSQLFIDYFKSFVISRYLKNIQQWDFIP